MGRPGCRMGKTGTAPAAPDGSQQPLSGSRRAGCLFGGEAGHMRKRSLSLILILSLQLGLGALDERSAGALTSVEKCFFSAINRERTSSRLPNLVLKDDLTRIARRHSRWMAGDGRIYHADSSSPHYREGDDLAREIPGNWRSAGENVGMGPDCQSIHDAFMASPGHRSNILDHGYNQVGIGVSFDHDGTVYVTEDFASRRSSPIFRRRSHTAPSSRPTAVIRRRPVVAPPEPLLVKMMLLLVGLD